MSPMITSRPRIMIADGQELTLHGLVRILEKNACDVIDIRSVNDLQLKLKESLPDVLIIDYGTLNDFAVEDLISVRQQHVLLPLMMVTSHRDKKTILKVLDYGVHGFLFKDCSEQELIRCTEALLRGERFFCNEVFDILMKARLVRPGHEWPSHLTSREVDIIRLIVKGYSTSLIADELNLSPHTISTHRKNIIRKLKIKSPVELVAQAYDLGLIISDSSKGT
ncbi:MAG: response regulator transcription factor [Bacteroidota bacterium]